MTCLVSITWEMGDHTTAADDVFGIDHVAPMITAADTVFGVNHVGNGQSHDCRL